MHLTVEENKTGTLLPKIMRAAIRLFISQGIDGTTTKDIARAAGVAEGALYRHFKSKNDLAWNIFQTHLDQFTNELAGKVLSQDGAKNRIDTFVRESFAAYASDPELFTYLILREHHELEKYAERFQHPGHLAIKIIEDGQKAGEIHAGDALLLGSLFVGAVIRVCVVKMYGDLQKDLRRYGDEVSESVWRLLRRER
jgi:AcrR family transcriptional regulator